MEYDLILRPDINTTGFTQWFYFAVSNTHPASSRPKVCPFCGKRKIRPSHRLPQYDTVKRPHTIDHLLPTPTGAQTEGKDGCSGSEDSEGSGSDVEVTTLDSDPFVTGTTEAAEANAADFGSAQSNLERKEAVERKVGAKEEEEVDANEDVSSEDDSSDEDTGTGVPLPTLTTAEGAAKPAGLQPESPGGTLGSMAGSVSTPPQLSPARPHLEDVEHPHRLYFCPATHSFTFNIINMRKNGSLFNEGMLPVVYSVHRAESTGVGWTRSGTGVKYVQGCLLGCGRVSHPHDRYYENAHVKGRTRRRRKAKHYSTLTFTVPLQHAGDVCMIAMSYPYVVDLCWDKLVVTLWWTPIGTHTRTVFDI